MRTSASCWGRCKGTDRPKDDSPAIYARTTESATVRLYCTCCQQWLTQVPTERRVKLVEGLEPVGRTSWECLTCDYGVESMRSIREMP